MKKILLIATYSIFSILNSYAQQDPVEVYPAVGQNIFEPNTYYLLSQFLIFSQYSARIKGNVKAVYDKEYNFLNGQVQKSRGPNLVSTIFDNKGNVIKQDFGRYQYQYAYELDEDNNLSTLTRTDGTHEAVFNFWYDVKHRVARRTMGEIVIDFTYGINNNPKQAVLTQYNKISFVATYIYNTQGYSIVEKPTDPKEPTITIVFVKDRVTEVKELKNGVQKVLKIYRYDLAGNIIEMVDKSQNDTHTYKFSDIDDKGNWTKRTHFAGNQTNDGTIIFRTIEYNN